MINKQWFELITMQKNTWGCCPLTYNLDFRWTFLLFDWDEIFVVDFDQVETRSIILNRTFNEKYYND